MKVKFNEIIYEKHNRSGYSLGHLCFEIFKHYLKQNTDEDINTIKKIFNDLHCWGNRIVFTQSEIIDTDKSRYFEPVQYNNELLFFSNQWGNNYDKYVGSTECDNIDKMVNFAINQNYKIEVMEEHRNRNRNTIIVNHPTIKQNKNCKIWTKNIILYGPPGVGKTYNHKKLISLIESGENQKDIFDSILNNDENFDDSIFEKIKSENRFKFVTFHQSYSYEDFIEGFRPNEDGSIKLEDGVFKELASEASKNLLKSNETNNILDFDNIVEQFQEENEIGSFLKTVKGKKFEILDYTPKSIHIKVNENKYSISYNPLNKILLENNEQPIQRPSDVIKVLDGFRGLATYYFSIFKEMLKYKTDEVQKVEQKNFYLLIDEINRGNISKIFGELITLIEDDKRDEIEITLPYSKEPFKVPSNLYIIATMNSTDKSIALIDVALRRRFTFLKMKPDAELILDERAKTIFVALNKIIEERIGEDYLIGHSYFMGEDLDLEFVLEYKIKPLLEEYFYADKEGVDEVLGIIER